VKEELKNKKKSSTRAERTTAGHTLASERSDVIAAPESQFNESRVEVEMQSVVDDGTKVIDLPKTSDISSSSSSSSSTSPSVPLTVVQPVPQTPTNNAEPSPEPEPSPTGKMPLIVSPISSSSSSQ